MLATPTIAVLEFSVNIEYDITDVRRAELLTGGPRFVGSPKIKSAFAFPPPPITRATTNPGNSKLILELQRNFISHLPFCYQANKKPTSVMLTALLPDMRLLYLAYSNSGG